MGKGGPLDRLFLRGRPFQEPVRRRKRHAHRLSPNSAPAPSEPCVGTFCSVDGVLVVDRTILAAAEPYADCLTHLIGHYELWERWRKLGARRLAGLGLPARIAASEYDEHPRGRVVYERPPNRFVIYADRRLQELDTIEAIRRAFGLLEAKVAVRSDPHYR